MAEQGGVTGAMAPDDLLEMWNSDKLTFQQRDELFSRIQEAGLYPKLMEAMDLWESEGGLYPDTEDPRFVEKLMMKQEFAENKQDSIAQQVEDKVNPCDPDREFELTPVQRFVGRFLSPQCPYNSALLYHGVGVGKTCAAITIAENYLRSYPRKPVFIVAPRNIQPGFKRTIFDDETLTIPDEESMPNTAKGCTGNTYLKRTGTEFEKDKSVVVRRITQSINSRYIFMGYIQFYRYIEDLLKGIPKSLEPEQYNAQRARILRREFSGRMIIIDEAHNLRDSPAEAAGDDADNPGGDAELTESQAGKKLTPSLEKVLDTAEGMKFVLLSGTPMYNSYKEIVFLLNLLLRNDKKALLYERDVFTPDGNFRPASGGRRSGEEILGATAGAYVSFMRGENPLSFPVRLPPQGTPVLESWPTLSPVAADIPTEERERMKKLPFVPVKFEGDSMEAYQRVSEEAIMAAGVGINSIDEMVQSGNWLFPADGGPQGRDAGFDSCLEETSGGTQFTSRKGDAKWLLRDNLGTVSPKAKMVLTRAQTARGPVFVYSRFIKSGAIPLALALEANGYTPWGDRKPLLTNGVQDGLGRQCALCNRREANHAGASHGKFVPAKYILITGRATVSPNNPVAIQAARAKTNMDGSQVKIVIGSQVASEGVDFRFIREIYVFDSWFHLNKMEQVLGRGIRTCSHSLLPQEARNCTIHLLVNEFGEGATDTETADLYMYRNAMTKAVQVGRVTRILKRYALDCNLNREAILVTGLATQRHVDSQGAVREEVNINDTPFTNLCDWIETCDYQCAVPVEIKEDELDMTTYDEYAARWHESELKAAIKKLFSVRQQPVFQLEEILEMMSAIPPRAIAGLLTDIVGNRTFRLRIGGTEGYIVYRNGYYMFQPDYLADVRIPLALRVAEMPVKKDSFEPTSIKIGPAAAAAAAPRPALAASGAIDVSGAAATPAAPPTGSLTAYWTALKAWGEAIIDLSEPTADIPESVKEAIEARYAGDEQVREKSRLYMITWLHEHIVQTESYSVEDKKRYLLAFVRAMLEMVWDESLRPSEQQELLADESDTTTKVIAREQLVSKGTSKAFRYVDPITGATKYVCGGAPCSEAVARVFEGDGSDPLNQVKANRETTGGIYGFLVPKAKEGRLVFKTSDNPPAPGGVPEKGSECAIVSTISFHIKMLKDIAERLVAEGFPKFILTEDILEEKARKKREREEAKATGRKVEQARKGETTRSFENAIRACALKDIILRWMDIMMAQKAGNIPTYRRYFFRPIAAVKSGHKGIVTKA